MGIDPEMLAAYIDQRLSPEQRAAVEAQLAKDPDSYVVLVETLKALDDESIKALPVKERTGEVRPFEPKKKPAMGRRIVMGVLAVAAGVALVVWTLPDLRRFGGERISPQFERLVAAVGEERYVEARLTGGFEYGPLRSVTRGDARTENLSLVAAAGELQAAARTDQSSTTLHAWGVAQLLLGQQDAAINTLEDAAATGEPSASLLSDLAAAYVARARAFDRDDDWPRALANADRAVARDPDLIEAWFNRALAIDEIHLREEALKAWREYLAKDSSSGWAEDARRAIARLESKGAISGGVPEDVASRDYQSDQLTAFGHVNSQRLREAFDFDLAPALVAARTNADESTFEQLHRRASEIAASVRVASGDMALVDSLKWIERIQASQLQHWNTALSKWVQGREDYQADRMTGMTAAFRQASEMFPNDSPFRYWSAQWVATGEYYAGNISVARSVIAETRQQISGKNYLALEGRLAWLAGTMDFQEARFEQAAESYGRAAEILERAKEPENAAAVTQLHAEAHARLGNYRVSWTNTRKAIGAIDIVRDSRRRYSMLAGAGASALNMGLPEVAAHLYGEALIHAVAFGSPGALVGAHQNLARAKFELKDVRGALDELALAEPQVALITDPGINARFRGDLLSTKALVLSGDDPSAAAQIADAALAQYSSISSQYRLAGLLRVKAAALLNTGNAEGAEQALLEGVRYLEDKRALMSQRTLRVSYVDAVWDLYQDLMHVQAIVQNQPDEALKTAERARGRSLLESYREGKIQASIDPARLGEQLTRHQAALFLVALNDRTLAWLIRPTGVTFRTIGLSRADVLKMSNRFRAAIEQGRDADAQRWATVLFSNVFENDGIVLNDLDHLVTIADGTWQTVPFAALHDSSGTPLLKRVRLSTSPSATVWAQRAQGRPSRASAVSVFAASSRDGSDFVMLPSVADEANAIRQIYGEQSLSLTRTDQFLTALATSDVVHFAGHAVPDEMQPWNSRLIFDTANGTAQRVTSLDIEQVEARATLVVLAACRTADGPPSRGEGLLTLARSFVSAGVRSVIATQWDVDDTHTAELIADFHRFYRNSADATDSLRQAQLQAIAQQRPMRSWAAFVSIGD